MMIVDQRLAASGLEPWKQRLLKNLLELRVLGATEKMYVWSGLDVWLVAESGRRPSAAAS